MKRELVHWETDTDVLSTVYCYDKKQDTSIHLPV